MIEVVLFLFGKPEWEIENLGEVSASEIREKAEELKERLHRIAEIVEKLENAGWKRGGATLYDIIFYKDITAEEAERELRQLGIDPEELSLTEIEEVEGEEEEEEDDGSEGITEQD